ncbi:MAG: class I SAM-dependent methyltransferase [Candidatus Omnitrophota bacterium]|jgi:SAM-dependent methyltransferase
MNNNRDKVKIEKDFHDRLAMKVNFDELISFIRPNFEACTALDNKFIMREVGDLTGKRILELGCGFGEASIYFALKKAEVITVDVSPVSIQVLNLLAERCGVQGKIKPKIHQAEDLSFLSNDSIDMVYSNSLHHTCYRETIDEVYRVLKKDGIAFFIEPLNYNPIIKIYRKLAKGLRTPTENNFKFSQLGDFSSKFKQTKHQELWFTTLLIFIYMFFVEHKHPSRVRYWREIIIDSQKYSTIFNKLERIDSLLLKIFPIFKRFSWNTIIMLRK